MNIYIDSPEIVEPDCFIRNATHVQLSEAIDQLSRPSSKMLILTCADDMEDLLESNWMGVGKAISEALYYVSVFSNGTQSILDGPCDEAAIRDVLVMFGQPVVYSSRNCVDMAAVVRICKEYIGTGSKSNNFNWISF